VERLQADAATPEVAAILTFIETSTRGLCAPRQRGRATVTSDDE
jgi:hypothetical protein